MIDEEYLKESLRAHIELELYLGDQSYHYRKPDFLISKKYPQLNLNNFAVDFNGIIRESDLDIDTIQSEFVIRRQQYTNICNEPINDQVCYNNLIIHYHAYKDFPMIRINQQLSNYTNKDFIVDVYDFGQTNLRP